VNRRRLIIIAGLMVALILLPLVVGGYWMRVLTSVYMYAIMAESLNIIAGYAGYPALGNAVFFGFGAYVGAVLMTTLHWPIPLALFMTGVVSAAFAAIIGLAILRLSGKYFLMATIGLLGLVGQAVTNLSFAGGGAGINLPVLSGSPKAIYSLFYYLMLAILIAVIATVAVMERRRFGFALRAIKFDEDAADVMGIRAVGYKTAAWAMSAFFTGLAGGVFALWMTYIDPPSMFDIGISVKMYLMFLFGGAGTLFGPVIGAAFMELVSELVWSRFLDIHYLVLGMIIILVVVFMPNGIMALIQRYSLSSLLHRFLSRRKASKLVATATPPEGDQGEESS
jgi:branched-chain amino acid transport system permease protein